MNRKGSLALLVLAVLLCCEGFAQDKIYLSSSAKQGKILDITQYVVTYQPSPTKKETQNVPLDKVLLLFNERGAYLIPAKLNFADSKTKQAIKDFLSQTASYWPADQVYKLDKTRAEGKITSEKDNKITLVTSKITLTYPKKSVALVIYQNGKHALLGNAKSAAEALSTSQGSFAGLPPPPAPVVASTPPATTPAVKQTSNTAVPVDTVAKPKPVIETLMPGITKTEFEQRATHQTNQFGKYLKILCNKATPSIDANNAIDLAVGLFVDEKVIVESASVNRANVKRRPIRTYLVEVKNLKYDRIVIEWTNVQYVDNIKPAPDGTYRGSVNFEQKFSGYRDGRLVYEDITEKRAEVILKGYSKMIEGQAVKSWEVLLGNIGVESITPTQNP